MLIACWSPKGGCGTTVVSCALAIVLARGQSPGGAVLADLAGDVPSALGMAAPPGPGLADWLSAGPDVGADALGRMEVDAGNDLVVLPWTGGDTASSGSGGQHRPTEGYDAPGAVNERAEDLAMALGQGPRPVVVDCGRARSGPALAVAAAADQSLLVIRPCYLAVRRALAAPIRPSGVIVVRELNRSLSSRDIEDVLGVPVRVEIAYDPAVARAVDAGLLGRRMPKGLERSLRQAA